MTIRDETKVVVTIAGSDSSAGAGIQGDLKTLEAHGVYGVSVVTAVTAQNTVAIAAVAPVAPAIVRLQLEMLFDDFSIAAVKIGMLADGSIATTVADVLETRARGTPIILDPVISSTSGQRLVDDSGIDVLRQRLAPWSTLVTPNYTEASLLTGRENGCSRDDLIAGLLHMGCRSVLLTGGDNPVAGEVVDLLANEGRIWRFTSPWLGTRSTHGTGCALSTAVAANIAMGFTLVESVARGRDYVFNAIRRAPGLGHGNGPLLHRTGSDD